MQHRYLRKFVLLSFIVLGVLAMVTLGRTELSPVAPPVAAKPLTQSGPIIEVTVWEYKQGQTSPISTFKGFGDRYELKPTVKGEYSENNVRIRNIGDAPLTISNITIEGRGPTPGHTVISLMNVGQLPFTLAPGDQKSFALKLGPTNVPAFYQSLMTITHNDTDFSTQNPFLVSPEGSVFGIPDIRVDFAGGSSGTLSDGTQFVDNSFDIFNDGDGTLTDISVSTSAGTIIQAPASNVSPGSKTTFTLRRLRSSSGCMSGAILTIRSNDPDENPVTIDLLGNCVAPEGDPTPEPTPLSPTF